MQSFILTKMPTRSFPRCKVSCHQKYQANFIFCHEILKSFLCIFMSTEISSQLGLRHAVSSSFTQSFMSTECQAKSFPHHKVSSSFMQNSRINFQTQNVKVSSSFKQTEIPWAFPTKNLSSFMQSRGS